VTATGDQRPHATPGDRALRPGESRLAGKHSASALVEYMDAREERMVDGGVHRSLD